MRFCCSPACRLYFLWDSVDRFCLRPAVAKAFEIFFFFTRFWMRSWCVYLSENQHIPKGNDIFQTFIFRGFSRLVSGSVTKRFPQNIGLPSTWAGWSEKFPTDKNSTTAELLNSNNMSRGCQRCKKQKQHIRKEVPPPNSWITRWLPKPQPKNPGSERSITFLKLREGDGPMVLLAGSPREGHIGFRHEKRRAPCRLVAYLGFLISEVHPGNHRSIQCASFISTFVGHKSLVGNVALLGSSRPRQFDLKYINHSRKTVEKWLRTWCD